VFSLQGIIAGEEVMEHAGIFGPTGVFTNKRAGGFSKLLEKKTTGNLTLKQRTGSKPAENVLLALREIAAHEELSFDRGSTRPPQAPQY
jgi:hypothetical protein